MLKQRYLHVNEVTSQLALFDDDLFNDFACFEVEEFQGFYELRSVL